MIRLVAVFDFATDDLEKAYASLREHIVNGEPNECARGWETSDEWYFGGDAGSADDLQAAIFAVLEKREKGGRDGS
jgi:hypothetical protein